MFVWYRVFLSEGQPWSIAWLRVVAFIAQSPKKYAQLRKQASCFDQYLASVGRLMLN